MTVPVWLAIMTIALVVVLALAAVLSTFAWFGQHLQNKELRARLGSITIELSGPLRPRRSRIDLDAIEGDG